LWWCIWQEYGFYRRKDVSHLSYFIKKCYRILWRGPWAFVRWVADSTPAQGMCVCPWPLYVVLCRRRPCDQMIARSRYSTGCRETDWKKRLKLRRTVRANNGSERRAYKTRTSHAICKRWWRNKLYYCST
jgi:hypothetical protein